MKLSKGQKKRRAQAGQTENTALKKNVETVTFQNPDVQKKNLFVPAKTDHVTPTSKPEEPEFDLKKARFEVMKMNMNSLSGSEKVDAEAAFAIRLGARPEKRSCVNYKELVASRKADKEKQMMDDLLNKKPKLKIKSDRKIKRRKNSAKGSGVVSAKKIVNSRQFKQKRKK